MYVNVEWLIWKMVTNSIIIVILASSVLGLPADPEGPEKSKCILPPYPAHGTYVTNSANAKPGDLLDFVALNITCFPGYGAEGSKSYVFCANGWWPERIPQCVSQCRLTPHPSVEYRCLVFGILEGSRACHEYELTGTVVMPSCRSPNYYSDVLLPAMRCSNGTWNYIAKCKPECGTITPDGEPLTAEDMTAKRGKIPWHAVIYSKITKPYRQICGGSLVTNAIIISVAHCFWSDAEGAQLPSTNYAVAVGKLYRLWNDTTDDAQWSDVKKIHIPPRFSGVPTNFQDDIALVIVKDPFEYKTYIRPVCVDFVDQFERIQLQPGNKGQVAGWGLINEDSRASQVLKVFDLPYVDIKTCVSNSSLDHQSYFTPDKFCAGYRDGHAAVCSGDAGGGLAFPDWDRGILRYYLRGVVSNREDNDHLCTEHAYAGFTQLQKHKGFIEQYWFEE